MFVHWNSHFLSPNIQNKCFSERSCLDAWLTQFPLFLLSHPISTLFSAAAPSFNKHSYKSKVAGTLPIKLIFSTGFCKFSDCW